MFRRQEAADTGSGHASNVRQLPRSPIEGRGLDSFRRGVLESDDGFRFFRNPLVLSVLTASVFLLCVSFGAVAYLVFRVPQEIVILHYNVYFGIDMIGQSWQAFVVPGAPLVFLAVNTVLARAFYGIRERVASHILLFSAFFASLAGAVVSAALLFINS